METGEGRDGDGDNRNVSKRVLQRRLTMMVVGPISSDVADDSEGVVASWGTQFSSGSK